MNKKSFIGEKPKKASYLLFIIILALNFLITANCFAAKDNSPNPTTLSKNNIEPSQNVSISLEEQKRYQKLRQESQKNTGLFSPSKVFSNLITLVLILLVIAWLYNKYGKEAMTKVLAVRKINQNAINILSTSAIGQGKYLHIVEIDGEKILIGATANNISFLKELKNTKTEKAVSDEQNNSNR